MADKKAGLRLLAAVAGLFGGAVLLGALAAPHAFNSVLWLGRTFKAVEGLRDVEFNSIASRCILAFLLAGLYPAYAFSGVRNGKALGLADRAWGWRVLQGFAMGCSSMLILFFIGWLFGAYRLVPPAEAGVAVKIIGYLVGAALLGFFEETIFRGALFGGLRPALGFLPAALIAGFIFSAVHFADPDMAVSVVYGHWDSGLKFYSHLFGDLRFGYDFFPFSLTLFAMAVALCGFYERYGSLFFSMGLHAGWIWGMRSGIYFLAREPLRLDWLFGRDDVVSKTYAALLTALAFLAWALVRIARSRRAAASGQGREA